MAAIWEVAIEVIDATEKRARFTGTRTDGEDITTCSVVGQVKMGAGLQASLDAIAASLFKVHTDAVAKEAQHAAIVDAVSDALKNKLDALEKD